MSELLPCPFCNSEAQCHTRLVTESIDDAIEVAIGCFNIKCHIQPKVRKTGPWSDTGQPPDPEKERSDARTAWNCRVSRPERQVRGTEASNEAINYGAMMLRDFQSPGAAVRSLQTQLHQIYIEMNRITTEELLRSVQEMRG